MANEEDPPDGPKHASGDPPSVQPGAENPLRGDTEGTRRRVGRPRRPRPDATAAAPARPANGKVIQFITQEKYDAMWDAYLAGVRSANGIARKVGVMRKTAYRAINQGWPDRNWPALVDKIKDLDLAKKKAEEAAHTEKYREQFNPLYAARRRNLDQANRAGEALFAALRKIGQNLDAATFIRYRRVLELVKDREGNPLLKADGSPAEAVPVDKAYVPADRVILALRAASTAIRDLGTFERVWLQMGIDEGDPLKGAGHDEEKAPALISPLTTEQIAWMDEHPGQLAPGVTDEMLAASFTYLLGIGRKPAG